MVEATREDDRDIRTSRRFLYDRCLLTALADRWRLETHTFHLPYGEMTPTLQDVVYLTGLPCAGPPVTTHEFTPMWRAYFVARFAGVLLQIGCFDSTHGPLLKWLYQLYVNPPSLVVTLHFFFTELTNVSLSFCSHRPWPLTPLTIQ